MNCLGKPKLDKRIIIVIIIIIIIIIILKSTAMRELDSTDS